MFNRTQTANSVTPVVNKRKVFRKASMVMLSPQQKADKKLLNDKLDSVINYICAKRQPVISRKQYMTYLATFLEREEIIFDEDKLEHHMLVLDHSRSVLESLVERKISVVPLKFFEVMEIDIDVYMNADVPSEVAQMQYALPAELNNLISASL